MAEETAEQVQKHRDQLKAELDALNPKYNALQAQFTELEAASREAASSADKQLATCQFERDAARKDMERCSASLERAQETIGTLQSEHQAAVEQFRLASEKHAEQANELTAKLKAAEAETQRVKAAYAKRTATMNRALNVLLDEARSDIPEG